MKVRIVHYELGRDNWILGKFAYKIHENLQRMGIESDVAALPDENADVNHHIIYYDYDCIKRGIDTLMITHIDNNEKLLRLKSQMQVADAGICMSNETTNFLTQMGINKDGLCYINPAHDGVMPIRKIVVGISCRAQEDGRKREYFLDRLAMVLDSRYFKFRIMGEFWDSQVATLKKHGFEVDHFDHFNYDEYVKFIPSLDYYLYMGMDEGQMGFIDALAAGIKTIVTAQGYHLDAPGGVVHPFTTYEELEQIFLSLQKEKEQLTNSIATWNWFDYTKKHVEIWNYLLNNQDNKSGFDDGLNSLLRSRNGSIITNKNFIANKTKELKWNDYSHLYYKNKRQFKDSYKTEGIGGITKLIGKKIRNKINL